MKYLSKEMAMSDNTETTPAVHIMLPSMRNLLEHVQEYVLGSEEDSYHHVRTGKAD